MKKMKFEHKKQFSAGDGSILTMKAIITINGQQFVEVYDRSEIFKPEDLIAIKTI